MRGQLLFQHFSLTEEDYVRPCSKDKHGALKLLVAAKHTGNPFKIFIFNILFLTKFVHLSLGVSHEYRCSGRQEEALDLGVGVAGRSGSPICVRNQRGPLQEHTSTEDSLMLAV